MNTSDPAPRYPSPGTAWLLVSPLTVACVVRYSVALTPPVFGLPVMLIAPLTPRLYRNALGTPARGD